MIRVQSKTQTGSVENFPEYVMVFCLYSDIGRITNKTTGFMTKQ